MIRIYPFGLRFGSSNFNPIPMLQCGCQLVSLNTQNVDVYYVCVQGMFERNRHCGYMLKPDIKQQNSQKLLYRIAFMDGMDLRPRLPANSDTPTTLQVSFIGNFSLIFRLSIRHENQFQVRQQLQLTQFNQF
jgi:hypothetical protein